MSSSGEVVLLSSAPNATSDDVILIRRPINRKSLTNRPSLMTRRLSSKESSKEQRSGSKESSKEPRSGSKSSLCSTANSLRALSLDCESINWEARSRQESCGPSLTDNYSLQHKLGHGSFASVWKAQRLTTQEDVCLKIKEAADPEIVMMSQNEYSMLQEVHGHRYIISALDFFLCPTYGCVLVLEYDKDAITLQDAVSASSKDSLSEVTAHWVVSCLLQAVAHVHQCHILHRDIKAENLLVQVDSITGDLCDLRLLDFNTARQATGTQCLTLTGTPDYLAPEVLLGHPHTELSDAWAVGICLYYMVTGAQPWLRNSYASHHEFGLALTKGCDPSRAAQSVQNAEEAITLVESHQLLQSLSAESRSLLGCLLEVNPAARPTAARSLEHVWLQRVPV